ncbi:MAG: hypothetical protein ACPG7F_01160 [Aggregatilineales bacterium]
MYTTLAAVKTELQSDNTTIDNELYGKIRATSRLIDKALFGSNRAVFAPTTETRSFRLRNDRIDRAYRIYTFANSLKDSLFTLESVVLNGTTVSGATLYQVTPNRPATALQLPSGTTWHRYCNASSTPPTIRITGVWGYHEDYANAWENEDTLQADITASATSLAVADVDGSDTWGETPRLSAGNLLKVNDEIMLVTATDTAADTAAVRRGMQGTTAAAHTSGDTVSVWQLDTALRLMVARQVAAQYAKQGGYTDMDISGGATQRGVSTFLPELLTYLNSFNYD